MSEKNEKRKKGGAHLAKKEKKPKKEKKVRTLKETIRLVIIIILIVILALAALTLTAYAVYRSWVKAPELPEEVPAVSDGSGSKRQEVAGVETGGDRKKDFYTFLVVGRDTGGGGLTDTILLVAYDVDNQKLNVMSIPRDTMVNVPWDTKKINSVYNMNGGGEKGIDALFAEVSQLVGFVPDFSVVVEWKAVGELVDAIGGVYFDVPRNMYYDDPTQNLHIYVSKGYQKLDGKQAMGVVRWRKNNDGTGYVTGDIGRIETQQAFLKTVVEQCLQIQNVTKIQEFARIFTENVETDLTVGNLVWFAEQAIFGGLKMENVNFITLPGNYNGAAWSRTYQMMDSYVLPYGDELLEVINENFNPYLVDRTADQQDIMSVNRDGSVSSSTGVVEDAQAARPPVRNTTPSSEPEPEDTEEPEDPVDTEEPEDPEDPDVPDPPGVSDPPDVSEPPDTSAPPGVPEDPDVPDPPDVSEPPDASEPPEEEEPPGEAGDPQSGSEDETPPQEGTDEETPSGDEPPVFTPPPFVNPAGASDSDEAA